MTTKPRTLHEKTLQALDDFLVAWSPDLGSFSAEECQDRKQKLIAALLEAVPRLDDHEKNDHGAGLIGQVASPLAETLPRPNRGQ